MDYQGNPTRDDPPSYAKDLFAYWENPGHTILAKTHPLISTIGDMLRGSKRSTGWQYATRKAAMPAKPWIPGCTGSRRLNLSGFQGVMQGSQEKGAPTTLREKPEKVLAPLGGIMPAARAYTTTDAQELIDRYNQLTRAAVTTKETQEQKKLKTDLRQLAANEDTTGFDEMASQAISEGNMTRQATQGRQRMPAAAGDVPVYPVAPGVEI